MTDSKHILVVDDDEDLTTILKDKLEQAGFSVLVEHDGEDGLKTALEKKPDLLLVDVKMPKMDGLTMLEKLRADTWGKNAKVIFLTVLDQPEVLSRALELKGFEYLVKTDWKIEDIIAHIRKRLGV